MYNLEPKPSSQLAADDTLQDDDMRCELASGEIIAGQFEVLTKLGSGGMSTVYRCLDLFVDRTVAVKVLYANQVNNPKALSRFRREARAIAKLDHPNIVRLHSFNFDLSSPYIVMENVEGITLANLIEANGPMDIDRVVRLAEQLCSALQYAHENGVIHRDLKPSNIIIERLDACQVQVKILDFGIAKMIDDTTPGATTTGELFGTPAYMSPEQALGKIVDCRTDQYSLACVLFECLTGTPPFVGSGQLSVMMQHVQSEIPTLEESTLNIHYFPEHIQCVLDRMLSKSPEDRYDSLHEVTEDLIDGDWHSEQIVSSFTELVDKANQVYEEQSNLRTSSSNLRALPPASRSSQTKLDAERQTSRISQTKMTPAQPTSRNSQTKLNAAQAGSRTSQTNLRATAPTSRSSQTDLRGISSARVSQSNLGTTSRTSQTNLRACHSNPIGMEMTDGADYGNGNLAGLLSNQFFDVEKDPQIAQFWTNFAIALVAIVLISATAAAIYFDMATQPTMPVSKAPDDLLSTEHLLAGIDVAKALRNSLEGQLKVNRQRQEMVVEDKNVTNKDLSLLVGARSIENLNLSYCENIGDEGITKTWHLPLIVLNLKATAITNNALKGIADHFPRLVVLSVAETAIDDGAIHYLAHSKFLSALDLRYTDVSHCASELSKITSLRTLWVDHTKFDFTDLNAPGLTRISASNMSFTDSSLSGLLRQKKLESLALNHTQIDDARFLQLSALSHLKEIQIQDCPNITARGIAKFRRALPSCEVSNVDTVENEKEKVLERWGE